MENSKYNIREICGDWALDIQWGKETIVLIFNSRNSAEFVKKILEWEDMHPNQAVPYVPVPQPGKPLTLDQLRERWERCEHCRGSNELRYPSAHELVIDGRDIYYHDTDDGWEGVEINFCPWCGRPLTDEAWAELERRVMG